MRTGERVRTLRDRGLTVREIALELGLAANTVRYHFRPRADGGRTAPGSLAPPPDLRHTVGAVRTRGRVRELFRLGVTKAEIARQLGLTKSTVSYHARRLGEAIDERAARRYDWSAVQEFYDAGKKNRPAASAA